MSKPLVDHLLPYQRAWIEDVAPVAIGEKSRRIGWTYASAFRAVDRRLRLGTHLYHTSADLSAAREFIEQCARWAKIFNAAADDLGSRVIDEQDGVTAFVLRFRGSGARIVAGSSNPKFFRSKGGDVDADEFAFHADPRELYKAMQPAALVWGHGLRLWSTHNGEASFFAKLVKSARGGDCGLRISDCGLEERSPADDAAESLSAAAPAAMSPNPQPEIRNRQSSPSLHSVTLIEAVEQGLVERIRGLAAPDPVARRDFIESIRASCADEDAWNEEYLCRPGSGQASLLPYPLIEACETEEGGGVVEGLSGGVSPCLHSTTQQLRSPTTSPGPLYAGFDVGRKRDRSVLWVLERVGDVFWTRRVQVLEDVTFTAQEQLLHALLADRAVKRLCVDSTGIGAMLAERLGRRWGHRAEAVHFSAPVKAELALPLLRLFQDRLVRVPADPSIRADLHQVRKIVTASNNLRLDAPRNADGHADRFWALALAYHATDAARGRPPLPAVVGKRPAGW